MSAAKSIDIRKVPPLELVVDERCQGREGMSQEAIAEYQAVYETRPIEMPPLDVFIVDGALVVVDGLHRYAAASMARVEFVRVRVVGTGDMDEAIYVALGANKEPRGLRRSNADKARTARRAVSSAIGQEQSNRAIAEHIGVSDMFVAKMRAEWEASQVQTVCTSASTEKPKRRKGRDGKAYPVKPPASKPPATAKEKKDAPLPFEPAQETAVPMPTYGRALLRIAADLRASRLAALDALPDVADLNGVRQSVERAIRDAEGALKNAEPVVCPRCAGAGCDPCGARGWLSRMAAAR